MTGSSHKGFTLLELLVALLVIALGMLAAVKASGGYAGNLNYLQERSFAHWVARNALHELQLEGEVTGTGTRDAEVEFAERDWYWRAEIKNTPDPDMKRVEVEVWAGREDEGESLSGLVGFVAVE